MTSLLEPSFLRRLKALRHHLVSEARSGGAADRVARRRGTSSEFREHRAYVDGDDPRRIDWMAYARTGEPVIKLFQAEEDTIVRLLVDSSASLGFGTPQKIEVARLIAAALAYLALAGSSRAQVVTCTGSADSATNLLMGAPQRGERAFFRICRELAEIRANGAVKLSDAVEKTLLRAQRPGLLIVLSDFLDPSPIPDALRRARAAGHDIALVQVLDERELTPDLEGDLALEDCESGDRVDVTLDAAALEAYALNLAGLLEELRRFARENRGSYVRMTTTDDQEGAVRRILARAVD